MIRTFNRSARMAAALAALASGAMLVDVAVTGSSAHAQGAGYDEPAGEVDLDTFYRELAPHGEWFTHSRWGTVWRPNVDEDWRPYTRGHWANSEEHGWIWVADEEWGWAPFHYGRWVHDDDEDEWLWIPGTEWAPAWVMWRQSDDMVGWAPLPPDAIWDPGSGLRFSATTYEGPRYYSYWSFVQPEYMFLPGLHRHLVPRARFASFWGRTHAVRDHHRFVGGRVYHAGIDRRWLESRVQRPIPLVSLRSVRTPRDAWHRGHVGTDIPVFRPRVTGRPGTPPPDWTRRGNPGRPAVSDRDGGTVRVSPGPMVPRPDGPRNERRFDRRGAPDVSPPVDRRVTEHPPVMPTPRGDRRFDRRGTPDALPPVDRRFTERPPVMQPRVAPQPQPTPPPTRDARREGRPTAQGDRPQGQPQPGRGGPNGERRGPHGERGEPRG